MSIRDAVHPPPPLKSPPPLHGPASSGGEPSPHWGGDFKGGGGGQGTTFKYDVLRPCRPGKRTKRPVGRNEGVSHRDGMKIEGSWAGQTSFANIYNAAAVVGTVAGAAAGVTEEQRHRHSAACSSCEPCQQSPHSRTEVLRHRFVVFALFISLMSEQRLNPSEFSRPPPAVEHCLCVVPDACGHASRGAGPGIAGSWFPQEFHGSVSCHTCKRLFIAANATRMT